VALGASGSGPRASCGPATTTTTSTNTHFAPAASRRTVRSGLSDRRCYSGPATRQIGCRPVQLHGKEHVSAGMQEDPGEEDRLGRYVHQEQPDGLQIHCGPLCPETRGRCHNAHRTPRIRLAARALCRDSSRGSANPRQPSSSPSPSVRVGITKKKGSSIKSSSRPAKLYTAEWERTAGKLLRDGGVSSE
jgi:hypothetical protein